VLSRPCPQRGGWPYPRSRFPMARVANPQPFSSWRINGTSSQPASGAAHPKTPAARNPERSRTRLPSRNNDQDDDRRGKRDEDIGDFLIIQYSRREIRLNLVCSGNQTRQLIVAQQHYRLAHLGPIQFGGSHRLLYGLRCKEPFELRQI